MAHKIEHFTLINSEHENRNNDFSTYSDYYSNAKVSWYWSISGYESCRMDSFTFPKLSEILRFVVTRITHLSFCI